MLELEFRGWGGVLRIDCPRLKTYQKKKKNRNSQPTHTDAFEEDLTLYPVEIPINQMHFMSTGIMKAPTVSLARGCAGLGVWDLGSRVWGLGVWGIDIIFLSAF